MAGREKNEVQREDDGRTLQLKCDTTRGRGSLKKKLNLNFDLSRIFRPQNTWIPAPKS